MNESHAAAVRQIGEIMEQVLRAREPKPSATIPNYTDEQIGLICQESASATEAIRAVAKLFNIYLYKDSLNASCATNKLWTGWDLKEKIFYVKSFLGIRP